MNSLTTLLCLLIGLLSLDVLAQPAPNPRLQAGGPGMRGRPNRMAPQNTFAPTGDFSVVTVGTGSPEYNAERSGPCALVQFKGQLFLVDAGNGTQARLSELGVPPGKFAAILLTHHHVDHNEEFAAILLRSVLRPGTIEVIGPPKTRELVDFTLKFYQEDLAYRLGRTGRSLENLGKPEVRELQGGEIFVVGEVKISTAKMVHSIHTVAYRFEVGGQAIVISGDTDYSEALVKLAKDADILVIDGGGAIIRRNGGGGQGQGGGAGVHANLQGVAKMAQEAGAKRLVLTHIPGNNADDEATARALGETYKGTVIVGRDLLETVAEGTKAQSGKGTKGNAEEGTSALYP
jgi:ribonuclease BN (tRNA processing enzyme)